MHGTSAFRILRSASAAGSSPLCGARPSRLCDLASRKQWIVPRHSYRQRFEEPAFPHMGTVPYASLAAKYAASALPRLRKFYRHS